MQEASDKSTTPNAARTISCKAWNSPADWCPSWVARCDIKGSSLVTHPICHLVLVPISSTHLWSLIGHPLHCYDSSVPPSHWSPISLVPQLICTPFHWSTPYRSIPMVLHLTVNHVPPVGPQSHWSPISLVPQCALVIEFSLAVSWSDGLDFSSFRNHTRLRRWNLRKLPRATTNVQKNKSYVGLFISYVGLYKSYVGLIKSYVGLYSSYVGDKIS